MVNVATEIRWRSATPNSIPAGFGEFLGKWDALSIALACKLLIFWLRGVDLNPSPALIPLKLLILQCAKLAQMAKTANLSYIFLTHCLLTPPLGPLPLVLAIRAIPAIVALIARPSFTLEQF